MLWLYSVLNSQKRNGPCYAWRDDWGYGLETNTLENDDRQVGRVLTRREVIALLGAAGAAMLTGCLPGQSNSAEPTGTPASELATPTSEATGTPLSPEAASATTMPAEASPTAAAASQPSCVV